MQFSFQDKSEMTVCKHGEEQCILMRGHCCCCRAVSNAELQTVIDEVQRQEAAGSIDPLPEDDTPTSILEAEPEPGQIVSRKHYPVLGAVELTLSNGMKVWLVLPFNTACVASLLDELCH